QQYSTGLSDSACIRTLRQEGRRPLSSIFDAFVGEVLVIAISLKRSESPLSSIFNTLVGDCYY
ncbi:MAG: hypothetical protein FWC02_02685, partial [Firmicutes bacterium]|nr:hypothetical protein [Bacillota bacterium]